MAILKHISVKNRFYSSAVEYLTCQFDEYTNKPVLDEKGRIQERENYLIAGVNCDVDSFGAECIEVNRLYGKNNSVKDVKAHHYIISFDPTDDITMEQAMDTVYSSHTFEKVERTSTGLFYQGSVYVMDMLREELEAT